MVETTPPPAQRTAPHAPTPPRRGDPSRSENIRSVLSTVAVLLIAPIIAVLLTAFVFQSYQVDGESMETTLQNNDRLIVWKVPKTLSRITGNAYIPNRGDVIVFTEPNISRYGQDPDKQLIKRVIGLPGEQVVIANGELTVYNQEHPDGFQPDKVLPYGNVIKTTTLDRRWTVGKDQIFVAGDNRANSLDSRTFGPVDAHKIVGKLVARVLPINNTKRF
jgi:signal peptidase I